MAGDDEVERIAQADDLPSKDDVLLSSEVGDQDKETKKNCNGLVMPTHSVTKNMVDGLCVLEVLMKVCISKGVPHEIVHRRTTRRRSGSSTTRSKKLLVV